MRIVRRLAPLKALIRRAKRQGKRIGFVPTMGAFHKGHLSLIRSARRQTDFVVVSLFVNPIQFDRRSDFQSYPRSLRRDAELARQAKVDLLFLPSARDLYPPDFQTFVDVIRLSRPWEGRFRPGHFRGVTTVVAKLFHLVEPDVAYFGQKDAQQARIVQQMIRDLNFPIAFRILPTVRESDGLAMSSRNQRLSSSARRASRVLFEALQEARRLIEWGERRGSVVERRMRAVIRREPQAQVEYAALVDPKELKRVVAIRGPVWAILAVRIGPVRLIDHATLSGEADAA